MTDLTRYRMLIDGAWVNAGDGGTFESMNPATGEPWAVIPEATAADVGRAVEAAHRAFTDGPWSRTTPTERGRSLRRLADLLADRSEQLGRTETVDTGKMLKETRWQAKYIADFFHFFAGCADKVHGATLPIDKPDLCVFTAREPLGVVAAVVPWNSQLFLVAVKLGPALAAGNTVVLKASEHASAAMLEFGRLIDEAGIPPGVVNIVTGHGDPCGRALTSHPLVARVSFTGGPESARHVVRNSAENFAQGLAGARRQVPVRGVRGRGSGERGQRLHRRHLRSQRAELRGGLAPVPAGAHRRSLPGRHGEPSGADRHR